MNQSATLRLHYFPLPGRAGPIRDLLHMSGIAFEDVHLPFNVFQEQKAAGTLPFSSYPVLEVNTPAGMVSSTQSNAILRYLGRQAGLYPVDDPLRALKVDEALDFGEDINQSISPSIGEQNPERRAEMRKKLAEETLPRMARLLEKLLIANGCTGFVVGKALTIADLKLWWVAERLVNGSLDGIPKTMLEGLPTVAAWRKNIASIREARLAASRG
jgi:prostaglandin-H2 D-isomerase / glutathione transferase